MRCPECGFKNTEDARICIKCGTKLVAKEPVVAPNPTPTPIGGLATVASKGVVDNSSSSEGVPTMKGQAIVSSPWDNPPVSPVVTPATKHNSVLKCESCGFYPLRFIVSAQNPCPNCNYTGAAVAPLAPITKEPKLEDIPIKQASIDPPVTPQPEVEKVQVPTAARTISIKNLQIGEEQKKFTLSEVGANRKVEFLGKEHILNRSNTDPSNNSISSQKHAEIVFKDGKWMISDHSSNGATFVQVKGEVELKNGMQLIIGNKIYEVEFD